MYIDFCDVIVRNNLYKLYHGNRFGEQLPWRVVFEAKSGFSDSFI